MIVRNSTKLLLSTSIATLMVGSSFAAFAQSAPADKGDSLEQIVVTGSRISRPDIESASPVTIVDAQAISLSGAGRIEDLINTLPQAIGGQTAFISNGADGTATVDLRGLGPTRTLVLVNGRRLQPANPRSPVADLNQIPASLVKRVEVLTGGASATYGADAVAGVVNFVLDSDFTGVQFDTRYSFYQHNNRNNQVISNAGTTDVTIRDQIKARGFTFPDGNAVDGAAFDINGTIGAKFDDGRGHVTAYFGYRDVKPIFQGDRDHASCTITPDTRSGRAGQNRCGGSGTAINATLADPTFGGFFFGNADGSSDFSGTLNPAGNGPYNFAPINYFQRPSERWTAGAFAEYEISPALKVYSEFMFADNRSVAQIAESGTFFNQYFIRCGDDPTTTATEVRSPFLNAEQASTLCDAGYDGLAEGGDGTGDGFEADRPADGVVPVLIGKRNTEGGPRRDDQRYTSYRVVLGFKGDISERWSYDLYGQFGTTILAQNYTNDFSSARLLKALNAVTDTRAGSGTLGQVVCAINADDDPTNDDASCAPYNPFQGGGIKATPQLGITQAAVGYVNIPGLQQGNTKETIVSGYVSGDLGALLTEQPVSLVVGAEYRKESLETFNDVAFQTGDLAGQGGPQPNQAGGFNVKEVFAELLVPILEDAPLAEKLSLELGFRYSDYSSTGNTSTYKILGEYSPVDAVKFRGGYNRAVRAPNIINLFNPRRIALFAGEDPCSGDTPTYTAAQCARTGVTAAQYGNIAASPASQYNQFIGGSLALTPEKADTWTAGVVIEPKDFVSGLVIKVDYFNIKVKNAITTYGAQTILDQCGLSGDALFCNLVKRAPGSGSLWVGQSGFVTNLTLNSGGFQTKGIDLALNYGLDIGDGRASFDFNGTYLTDYIVDNGFVPTLAGADGKYNCAGFFGSSCGVPLAKWRHTARLGYNQGFFGVSLRWRMIGSVTGDVASTDVDLGAANAVAGRYDKIGKQHFFDLAASFNVSKTLALNVGINNIFDKDPPLVRDTFAPSNGNTFVETYDPAGRYVFIGASVTF